MTSKKKIAANRQRKATPSINAVRHGLRTRTVVLPDQNREDFDEILVGLQDQYQPQNASEQHLVDQAAIAQWKLVRAEAYEARAFAKDCSIEAGDAMFRHMTLVAGRLERVCFNACKELGRVKAAPRKQPEPSKNRTSRLSSPCSAG